ncbi:PepSY domain-containing protein [Pseudonocardia sp. NPDC049635]|uniref:PepSY-associated TM helix domain-containing protein n=1 Tax=Pseudonocardia sp. NPDC049635 TaxID=3155506 RepID=UPI0033E10141
MSELTDTSTGGTEPVPDRSDGPPVRTDGHDSGLRRGRGSWWWSGLRPLVLRLHFYVGVFIGPFILVAAVTGLLYTITPQLDQILYRDALHVPVGSSALTLQEQAGAAAEAVPGGVITQIRPPVGPDSTTRVTFDAPGVAEDYARTAFVDPYTGEVRAVLDTFGEWLPARAWIDTLHRNLHLGDVGRVYSELAASWLWVLALSGIMLWVIRRRRAARVRRTLLPERSARGRARLRSWHGAVGLWAALGMLVLSATGLTWSNFAGSNVGELRSALSWTTPRVSQEISTPDAVSAEPSADPATVGALAEEVLATARAAGMSGPVAITPPDEAAQAWKIAEVTRSWPLQQDAMAIDPATGQILDTVRFADWPLMAQAAEVGISMHMGILFGVANQLLLAAVALAIICVVVWGYRMWWLRRPTRPGATAPGGVQQPSAGAVALVGLAAIVLGVFFPLLGVSLVLFLLIDAVRRSRQAPAGPDAGTPGPSEDPAPLGEPAER